MEADLPTVDKDAYLAVQARELLGAARRRQSCRAVRVVRHVVAEAGHDDALRLANWYLGIARRETSDPGVLAIARDCLREVRGAGPMP
ncbi:hypothetical protein SacmaDRAFT_2663 [Saccharomonospora marina XMU15]|uniref:Uncharacterized protein n=1 Tax=Saccharomonospora marina XMU15 TaxID=882083 RepID=H5X1P1_9PSEU|nr:hypothetical protein [Saccharomonospora marina]EHR50904.1 hypothetical protein SacmaDRAFT_2663 [Saccharomonospora marina XMU15]